MKILVSFDEAVGSGSLGAQAAVLMDALRNKRVANSVRF